MHFGKNGNIESAPKDICPVTGLSILHKTEWTYSGVGEGHRITAEVIGNNILHTRNFGYATLPDVENAVGLTDRVLNEAIDDGRPYVHILDYSNLKGATLDARRYFMTTLRARKSVRRGMIFYGTSLLLNVSINLATRLNIAPFEIHVVKDYAEAVRRALHILDVLEIEGDASPAVSDMSKPVTDPGKPHREIITRDDWFMETDNHSIYFEIIDGDILHSVSAGIFEEHLIDSIGKLREKVIESGIMPHVSYYSVIGLEGIEKADWKARRLYIESEKEWYDKHPFRMIIFYGANRMIRAAFNMARPFLSFDARMVGTLEESLELIAREKTKRKPPDPLPAAKDTTAEPTASEQTQQYVDELLHFIGSIPLDSEGVNPDRVIGPFHPFRHVFDAITLIKNDMDELMKERMEAEKELLKRKDRYHALFDNNPIDTVIVNHKGVITEYNLAKEKSGGSLPDINNDVLYKDYAGKHKTNMFEEMMECIELGISKEFPGQKYKDKYLDIRIAPFSGGAIIISIDITDRKHSKERIKRLNSILMAIRSINQMLVVETDRDSLLQKACDILVEARGYDAAWLALTLDGKTFATVKGAGFRSEDVSLLSERMIDGDYSSCIGRIIAEKQKLVIVDKAGECGDCFLKGACAGKETAIIRVGHADRFYGLLAILFGPDFTADEDEKELLKEIAGDIGIALNGMEMEETLIASKQRLADVIDFLPDATFAINLEGKVIAWNHAIEEMTGVKAADMLGKGNYEYSLPFYGDRRPILIDLVFKPVSEIEKNYSFVHREGDALIAEANVLFVKTPGLFLWAKASPMCDHKGNVIGAVESIRDITGRKLVEDKLKVSEAKYRAVFENTGTATIIIEDDTIISMVNTKFERLSGYSREEVEGKMRWADFAVEEDLDRMQEYHNKRREKGEGRRKKQRRRNMNFALSTGRAISGIYYYEWL